MGTPTRTLTSGGVSSVASLLHDCPENEQSPETASFSVPVAGIESDTLADPTLRDIVYAHRTMTADVLLPRVVTYDQQPVTYPHWRTNQGFLHNIPNSTWSYALVSAGRYSLRFMAYMRAEWQRGEAWYEEIWFPTLCKWIAHKYEHAFEKHSEASMDHHLQSNFNCQLDYFLFLASPSHRHVSSRQANLGPFRFRPVWECGSVLRRSQLNMTPVPTLWHPVKDRRCWLDRLERLNCSMHNASECDPLRKHSLASCKISSSDIGHAKKVSCA